MGTYGRPGPSITFNMAEEVTKNEILNSTKLIHIFPIFGHKQLERWARMVSLVLPFTHEPCPVPDGPAAAGP